MEYVTTDMSFGAYLLTTRKLKFLRIDHALPFAKIVFDDPTGIGTQTDVDFQNGASAHAADYHSRRRYLRKKLDTARKEAEQAQAVTHA